MVDICSAILKINPSAQVSVSAEDLDKITWHADTPVIPKADIEAMMAELKADYDSKQYQRDRVSEGGYANLGEQFDMQYHDTKDGTTTWIDHVDSVKTKFPKP